MNDEPSEKTFERRRHPKYARRTAAVTFGLFGGGMACLGAGIMVRGTQFARLETILDLAFVACAVTMLFYWFKQGETTSCPECGRQMFADPNRDRERNLTFTCHDCQIEWDINGLHDM